MTPTDPDGGRPMWVRMLVPFVARSRAVTQFLVCLAFAAIALLATVYFVSRDGFGAWEWVGITVTSLITVVTLLTGLAVLCVDRKGGWSVPPTPPGPH
jgi:hypothetical protein